VSPYPRAVIESWRWSFSLIIRLCIWIHEVSWLAAPRGLLTLWAGTAYPGSAHYEGVEGDPRMKLDDNGRAERRWSWWEWEWYCSEEWTGHGNNSAACLSNGVKKRRKGLKFRSCSSSDFAELFRLKVALFRLGDEPRWPDHAIPHPVSPIQPSSPSGWAIHAILAYRG
jgi:hypothetical protein